MFLILEGEDIVCLEGVVALVRHDGVTHIVKRDNTVRETRFTPPTLRRRYEKLFAAATKTEREEQLI